MPSKRSIVTIKIEVPCYTAAGALTHAQSVVDKVHNINSSYVVKAVGVTGA